MDKKTGMNNTGRSFTDRLNSLSTSFTKSYDHSICAHLAFLIRRNVLRSSTRIAGVFLLTFGIYSGLVAWVISLFTDLPLESSAIYGGIILSVCSIPLILSPSNISEALLQSYAGSTVCDYLHIRRETLFEKEHRNRLGAGFVFGVLAGLATAIFPFESVVLAIATVIVGGIILCVPEAGVTVSAILLFVADTDIQYVIISITALSFLFKLIRGKRRIQERKTDLIVTVFLLCSMGAFLFCRGDLYADSLSFAFLMIPFFLTVYLMRDCRKATKLLHALVFSTGCLCAVYIMAFSISLLAQNARISDSAFLLDAINKLPAFETGFMPLAQASVIPIAVAFMIKPQSKMSRASFILSLVSMTVCLLINGDVPYLACALIITALLLIITGSRWIYFAICATLFSTVMITFAGSFGERIYNYVYKQIYQVYNSTESISKASQAPISDEYLLCGSGFSEAATSGSSFFYSILSALGIVGFILFSVFILFIIGHAVRIIIKAYTVPCLSKGMTSYRELGDRDDIKMGMIASVCSLGVILICCTFCNLYKNELSYLFFFTICGICSAYARSADNEISKIQGSLISDCSKEQASVVIGREQN
ncbi:MAG: hypothetical protein IJD22_00700 [Clostridia bacterium]|nr:hypothetical protein [Clostridia bacterium]